MEKKKFSLSVTDLAHAQYGHMIPMTLLESLLSLRRHQTFDWVELVYSDFQFGNTTPASFKTPCTAPGWDQAAHQSDINLLMHGQCIIPRHTQSMITYKILTEYS